MVWAIDWDKRAAKELKKLNKQAKQDIVHYLNKHILGSKNPKHVGKPLKGNKVGLWRYRIGNYRVICCFEDKHCIVLILRVAHRQSAYK